MADKKEGKKPDRATTSTAPGDTMYTPATTTELIKYIQRASEALSTGAEVDAEAAKEDIDIALRKLQGLPADSGPDPKEDWRNNTNNPWRFDPDIPYAKFIEAPPDPEPEYPVAFPNQAIPRPNFDKYFEPSRPFTFDDSPDLLKEWFTEVKTYFYNQTQRSRSPIEVLGMMANWTKPRSRAKRTLQAFQQDCFNRYSTKGQTLMACPNAWDAVLHIIKVITPMLHDPAYTLGLTKEFNKWQRKGEDYREFLLEKTRIASEMNYDTERLLRCIIDCMRDELKQQICQRLNKEPNELTYNDVTTTATSVALGMTITEKAYGYHRTPGRQAQTEYTQARATGFAPTKTYIRWDTEDYKLIRQHNLCLKCGDSRHTAKECTSRPKEGNPKRLSDNQRNRLLQGPAPNTTSISQYKGYPPPQQFRATTAQSETNQHPATLMSGALPPKQ